eukprot:TRINITY_DN110161_c0_g1_i1.p1 TRINITY_DN110161_c0_g1~~TRINITY_DN110161_c0_g1_i1.p1  ORF type:complete len:402 (-),score=52.75 TRINITY_DN110161_c0_g1_i1:181-1386(-)
MKDLNPPYSHMLQSAGDKSWWVPSNPDQSIRQLEGSMMRHALISWVLLPILVVAMGFVPQLAASCSSGFTNLSLLMLLLIEVHHIFAESQSWAAVKDLIAPPELAVLRQLGVLRQRSRWVFLGILEVIDLYTDLVFPWIAHSCDLILTENWTRAWSEVPFVGPYIAGPLEWIRFWGFSLLGVSINVVVTGLFGLWKMQTNARFREQTINVQRISGDIFFGWTQSAETALMPSVSMLCEEMASERQFAYDLTKIDTVGATEARRDIIHGKADDTDVWRAELFDSSEREKVVGAGSLHYWLLLFVKVCLGNVFSLWIQGSFLALTFETTEVEARVKLIVSMVISAVQAAVRCCAASSHLGLPGCVVSVCIMGIIAWSFVKVYHAYTCPGHLWNLTSGCVDPVV